MDKITEIVLAQERFEQGLSQSAIARRMGRDRETIRLWLRGIEEHGQKAFLNKSASACRVPRPSRQVDALVKGYIWAIREREHGCCGQKIAYFLEHEHGVKLSVPKIYEVLAQRYAAQPIAKFEAGSGEWTFMSGMHWLAPRQPSDRGCQTEGPPHYVPLEARGSLQNPCDCA